MYTNIMYLVGNVADVPKNSFKYKNIHRYKYTKNIFY